ncbi:MULTISPECIES: hypothetical protein [unclassified Clostridium]|uniref:hypothetical protein n=1 Tax=unclassified Clostridium TaxID=2614128 RepID=UPI0020793BA5|nr:MULTISPECIES: hypothetical protein [unclassified Clostridium]
MNNKESNKVNHVSFLKTDVYKRSTDADFITNLNKSMENTVLGDDFSNAIETIYENPHTQENLKDTLVESLESTEHGRKVLNNTSTSKSNIDLSAISNLSNKLL